MKLVNAHPDTLEPGRAWIKDALCASDKYADEPDLWFSSKSDEKAVRRARQICWSCPVIEACAQWAYERREPFGLWGGVAEAERRALLRRRGIRIKDTDPEDDQPAEPQAKASA